MSFFAGQAVVGGIRLRDSWRCDCPLLSLLVSLCQIRSPRFALLGHLAVLVSLSFCPADPSVAAFPHLDQAPLYSDPGSCSSPVDFSIY